MRKLLVLLVLFAAGLNAQSIGDLVVFAQPFGADISTIKASPVGPCTTANPCVGFPNGAGILNKSQGGHLLVVYIPTAVADVTSLAIQIEASYTCPDPPVCTTGSWFPISPQITVATFVSGSGVNVGAIGVTKANGAFPYVRVNSLNVVPGGAAMTVRYSGFPFPIGSAEVDSSTGEVKIYFIGPVSGPVSIGGVQNKFLLVEGSTTVGDCAVFQADGNVAAGLCSGSSLSGLQNHMTFWRSNTDVGETPGIIWEGDAEIGDTTLLNIGRGAVQVATTDLLKFTAADHTTIKAGVNANGTIRSLAPIDGSGAWGAYVWPTTTTIGAVNVWSKLGKSGNTMGVFVDHSDTPNAGTVTDDLVLSWSVDATTGRPFRVIAGQTGIQSFTVGGFDFTASTASNPSFTFDTTGAVDVCITKGAQHDGDCPIVSVANVNPSGFPAATYSMYIDVLGGIHLGGVTSTFLASGTLYGQFGSGGGIVYCYDCNRDAGCTGGGTGALALYISTGWVCNP